MKFYYGLPAALIGVSIALVQTQVAVALSSSEVGKIAKEITVRIEGINQKNPGSGVIIKHIGTTYYVLTAAHVVPKADKYEIITPDGDRYQMDYSTLKKGSGVDLAVVQFKSSKTYTVAKMGNSDKATEGAEAYVCGFPIPSSARPNSEFNFLTGKIIANGSQPQPDGYTLVYSNNTRLGMSGGPVLNENGEVVGVHGRSETTVSPNASNKSFETITTGNNLGIPINTFLKLSLIDGGVRPTSLTTATAPKADDFYIQGNNKFDKGDTRGAIAAFDQAIRLNPKYAYAYKDRGRARFKLRDNRGAIEDLNEAIRLNPNFSIAYAVRGSARSGLGDNRGAIEDFNQAIRLNPKDAIVYAARGIFRSELRDNRGAIEDLNEAIRLNPNFAIAYVVRGRARSKLGDNRGAIEDFNQAIRLNPKEAIAHAARGSFRYDLGDNRGAIEDFNQAIRIDSTLAGTYNGRGIARSDLGDNRGAIEDFNQAIRLNSTHADAYNGRGIARFRLKDNRGAIEDFNQAIRLNPNFVQAYNNRGVVHANLGDNQGAIEDFNQAIRLNPNFVQAYAGRGNARFTLKDKQGALADLQRAADLAQQQENTDLYQKIQNFINKNI